MIQVGSINLVVTDVAAVERFYVEMLGLRVDAERTNRPSFVLLRADNCMLILQQADAASGNQADARSGTAVEIGFQVDNVDALREKLGNRAVIQQMGWGRAIETTDPEGTRLNLYQWE